VEDVEVHEVLSIDGKLRELVEADKFLEADLQLAAFLPGEGSEVGSVIGVGEGGEFRNERAAGGGKGDLLIAAVRAGGGAGEEFLVEQAVRELGHGAAGEAGALGDEARGDDLGGGVEFAEDDPLGDGDSRECDFGGKGLGDVVGDEAEPEAEVILESADGHAFRIVSYSTIVKAPSGG
jgi:hypothetical protein